MTNRLAIVDDDAALLSSLVRLFSQTDDFQVVGAYGSAEEAVAEADWSGVDLLLTDLEMPGMTGVGLIAAAVTQRPGILAVAYTVHEHRENLFAALKAGASGYIIKGGTVTELIDALRGLAKGHAPLSPSLAIHLIEQFRTSATSGDCEDLSIRERQLLEYLSTGMIYKEIAEALNISQHTVHNHVKSIYAKLHVKNRAEAIRRARLFRYL